MNDMPSGSADQLPMLATRILVWEATGHWAAWLSDAIGPSHAIGTGGPRIHQLRGSNEVEAMLREAPAAILAVEFRPDNWESRCHTALNWLQQYGQVRLLALSCVELAAADNALRELGAIDVAYSQSEMPRLARIVLRHVRRFPMADRTLCDQWLDRIPWLNTSSQDSGSIA